MAAFVSLNLAFQLAGSSGCGCLSGLRTLQWCVVIALDEPFRLLLECRRDLAVLADW